MNEEKSFSKTSINWYPGHMAKTKREVSEKLNLIDVVFEVIDARIPKSSKNKEIDELIKNKPRILIMTKTDLADEAQTVYWQQYYQNSGYEVVAFDLLHDKNLKALFAIVQRMMGDINKKRKEKGLKPRRVRILILGIPNVGKSTLINRLVGKKATNVGNKPGVTKSLEWIRINNEMELLDTPGILWPKLDEAEVALNLAAMTAIKEEVLNREEVAIYILKKLSKCYPDALKKRYNLEDVNLDTDDKVISILERIAGRIGAIRNQEVDYEKVYMVIQKDLRDGLFGKVTFDLYED